MGVLNYLRIANADIQECRSVAKGNELKVVNPTRQGDFFHQ